MIFDPIKYFYEKRGSHSKLERMEIIIDLYLKPIFFWMTDYSLLFQKAQEWKFSLHMSN